MTRQYVLLHCLSGNDCELTEKFSFLYKAQFDNGLTEHELDFIFIGKFNGIPNINPEEVNDYAWMMIEDVLLDAKQFPNKYTEWFKIILNEYMSHLEGYLYKNTFSFSLHAVSCLFLHV